MANPQGQEGRGNEDRRASRCPHLTECVGLGVIREASDTEQGTELTRRDARFLFPVSTATITEDMNTAMELTDPEGERVCVRGRVHVYTHMWGS